MTDIAHDRSATGATVGDFAQAHLLTCAPDTPVAKAAALMRERACSSVLVVEHSRPIGIWTEHDAARTDFTNPAAFDAPISSVMSGPLATITAASEVAAAVARLQQAHIRHLVVVDDDGALVGIVTQTDLALRYGVEHFLRLRVVGDVIGTPPLRLPAELAVGQAALRMSAAGRDAVIVERADGVLGILTERDLLGLVARRQTEVTLGEMASFPLRTITAAHSLLDARRLLIDGHIRHLGITAEGADPDAGGELIGLLSLQNILEMLERTYAASLADVLRQRDDELLRSREDLTLARQVIESSDSAMMVLDPAGRIVSVNPAFEHITGHPAATAIGQQPDALLNCDGTPPDFCHDVFAAVNSQGYWRGDLWCRRQDGALRALSMNVHAVTHDGQPTGRYAAVFFDITENAEAARTLREERDLIAAGPSVVFKWAPVATWPVTYVSPNVLATFGYQPQDLLNGSPPFEDLIHTDDRAVLAQQLSGQLNVGGVHFQQHYRLRHADGRWRWIDQYTTVVRDEAGSVQAITGYVVDVTERRHAEDWLQLAASVFSHAREGIVITSPDGIIAEVNEAFTRITGYSRAEVIGKSPSLLKSGRQGPEFYAGMWQALADNGYWSGEVWNRRKTGEVYAELLTISAVFDASGGTRHYVALFSDITAQKEHQQQLEHIAHYDALTGLPNRVLLADRMRQALAQVKRRGQQMAVAYIDLDGFKAINDHHGHEAGDQLLMILANRMKQCLRDGDTIARLGGDEFVALLVDLPDIQDSVPLILQLLAAAAQPVHCGGLTLHVSGSIGVSFHTPSEDNDADQLLRQADQAMYQAKLAGKNRYHVFDAEQDRNVRGHHESIERIRQGLAEREFVLHYQPKVNLRSGALVGVEALIRWQHPQRGLLAPMLFLPDIEDHFIGVELGEWVIDTALAQQEQWQQAGLDIPVSVNIAAYHLQQDNFVHRLQSLLAAHPTVPPGRLELEVLETSALEDIARVSSLIEACAGMGISFALDDFGTGYSSLTYLKRLPARILKIDQSFVCHMLDDPDDLAILDGVLGLAAAFGRQAIAEGMETVAHGETLLWLGCELAQGFGIARPMPADELPQWQARWQPDPVWAQTQRLDRERLPQLFAGVQHRAWIRAISDYLDGHHAAPVPLSLDPHHCHFGQWLDKGGNVQPPARQAEIMALHQQVHALADQLLAQHAAGQTEAARAGLPALHALRDSLLAVLMR